MWYFTRKRDCLARRVEVLRGDMVLRRGSYSLLNGHVVQGQLI
jgi:hypothetical protein